MSKCIYKEIADRLNRNEFAAYYATHMQSDVALHFGFGQKYLTRILNYLGIKRRTPSETSKLYFAEFETEANRQKRIIAVTKRSTGRIKSEDELRKMSEHQKGLKHRFSSEDAEQRSIRTRFKKGNVPWNKGRKGAQHWTSDQAFKINSTKRKNKTFNSSKIEQELYELLIKTYGCEDVMRQYSDPRYHYQCDFYIKSKDLFIELNAHWTHGGRPFDPNDESCQRQLKEWEEKAKTSKFYQQAIDVWTRRDVEKRETAIKNNIPYNAIYVKNYSLALQECREQLTL